jgi:enamine deaminase RidA (YjgF/YER057c/UK114 family)
LLNHCANIVGTSAINANFKRDRAPTQASHAQAQHHLLTHIRRLYIGGQIGWNAQQQFESDDFILQMRQTLINIVAVLDAAGARVQDLVRLTWYVIDKREYLARQAEVGQVYRDIMGRHFPAMTMVVVAGLVEDRALLEIEATAVMPRA